MSIKLESESVIRLTEVPKLLPVGPNGRRVHIATLYRWSTGGCRGVRLETVQVGATRCTSREALQRFVDRLTYGSAKTPAKVSAQRQREIDEAEAELEREGI